VSLPGFDPSGQGTREFWIEKDLIGYYYRISKLDKWKELNCVKEVMGSPSVIFKGLQREGQEESLCYAGLASRRYSPSGEPRDPRPHETFAVFILSNDKIFRWGWEPADDNLTYPLGYRTRFGCQLWPKV
jgi:hypothetical protein